MDSVSSTKENRRVKQCSLVIEPGDVPYLILLKEKSTEEVILQLDPKGEDPLFKIEVDMKPGSSLKLRLIAERGDVKLKSRTENGGALELEGLFHAKGNDKLTISVESLFSGEDTEGNVVLKGVAEDRAHVVCKGMIDVDKGCKGFKGFLKEDILILDPGAKVDLVPGLEIKNDDVRAGHSASVRRINPEDLFYFASRGISEMEARGIIVNGFLVG